MFSLICFLFIWVEMPAIIAKSIAILSDAGLGMAMFSLCMFQFERSSVAYCHCSVFQAAKQPRWHGLKIGLIKTEFQLVPSCSIRCFPMTRKCLCYEEGSCVNSVRVSLLPLSLLCYCLLLVLLLLTLVSSSPYNNMGVSELKRPNSALETKPPQAAPKKS